MELLLQNHQVASATTPQRTTLSPHNISLTISDSALRVLVAAFKHCRCGSAAALALDKTTLLPAPSQCVPPLDQYCCAMQRKSNKPQAQNAPQCYFHDIQGRSARTQNTLTPIPSLSDPCLAVRAARALHTLANGCKNHAAPRVFCFDHAAHAIAQTLTETRFAAWDAEVQHRGSSTLECLEHNRKAAAVRAPCCTYTRY